MQSVLSAAGAQAQRIESHWWVLFWVTLAVTVVVLGMLAWALVRGSRAGETSRNDGALQRAIGIGTGLTVFILLGLLVHSMLTTRALAGQREEGALEIAVMAQQWWWSVEYQHPEPEQRVRTANELHIPVGRTVSIKLLANDVIHSFWVPALNGKLDAIPGHEATLWIRAERAGVYRGQCAEYCGTQHAHMGIVVIAEPPADFERWIQAQRQTAQQPQTEQQRRGLQLVQQSACVMCHTIRGTAAGGRIAPDLTHVGSRVSLGAGTLANNPTNLAIWISDSQTVKPRTLMPPVPLSTEELDALVAFLEGLK